MNTFVKLLGTAVGLILVFAGGVDFGLTTVPGIALIMGVWAIKW
jgi:hypothetical protein